VSYCADVLTRFAPTPSGFLHIGNLVNFALIHRLASKHDARIALRIDDVDAARTRPEYLADIFDALEWLDLSWDLGPTEPAEMSTWSQLARLDEYRRARDQLLESGHAYACTCTRRDWIDHHGARCPRSCADRRIDFEPGVATLRFTAEDAPDPVIWRREDLPAYHLTSVVDDDLLAVDLIVRGDDLREATQIQRQISAALPESPFRAARVVHHPLVKASDGAKLSKSAGARSSPLPRTPEIRSEVDQRTVEMLSLIDDRLRSPGS
jgi:glutamyl/glutaminyl-tRNA synthetase